MIDSHSLKPILMINDCITNDELKIICYNCITDCKTNCCGCKKNNLPCSLYYGKNSIDGDVICSMNALNHSMMMRWTRKSI